MTCSFVCSNRPLLDDEVDLIEDEPLIDLELASQELKRPKDQIMIACHAFLSDDKRNGFADIKQNLFDGDLYKMQSAA